MSERRVVITGADVVSCCGNGREAFFDGTPYNGHYNAEVVEDVLMMDALGIPCGVYWVDRPWAKGKMGYEDFEWDRNRLPHPEEMIDWLDDLAGDENRGSGESA